MVAANLPDVDVAVFFTNTLPVSFRRGWTHGVLAQVTLPIVLAGVMWRSRAPVPTGPHLTAPAGTSLHPSGRYYSCPTSACCPTCSWTFSTATAYGSSCRSPSAGSTGTHCTSWIPGCIWYSVAGVWLASRAERRGASAPPRPARIALVIAATYMLVMLGSNAWARAVVRDGLTRAGLPADTRFMVTPVLVNPFRREVLVDTGSRYEKGVLWFEPTPHFRPAGYGVEKALADPDAAAALARPRARDFLRWSRFPFVVIDRTKAPPRVFLNDYRYSDAGARAGWAGLSMTIAD